MRVCRHEDFVHAASQVAGKNHPAATGDSVDLWLATSEALLSLSEFNGPLVAGAFDGRVVDRFNPAKGFFEGRRFEIDGGPKGWIIGGEVDGEAHSAG